MNKNVLMFAALFTLSGALVVADEAVETVVVTATRTELDPSQIPVAVSTQSFDELRDLGLTYGSEEFRGVPGIFVRRGQGDGDEFLFVSVRGSDGTDGYLALLDGVPFVGPDEEPLLNQLPYDALERVEIVKGPVSALYGRGGLYGAANYLTRSPSADAASFGITAGNDDYYRGEGLWTRNLGRVRVLLSTAYESYGGWRDQADKKVINFFGRTEIDLTDLTTLDFSVNYFDRDSEVPNAIPTTPEGDILPVVGGAENFLGYGDPRNQSQGMIGTARLVHSFSDQWAFSFVTQIRSFDQDLRLNFYDPFGLDLENQIVGFNGFYTEAEQNVYFAETSLTYKYGIHSVIAGFSGERANSNSVDFWSGVNGFTPECGFNFYLIQLNYTTGQIVNDADPCFVVDEPLTRDKFVNTFWGAFIQDQITFSENWRLTVGARYDSFKRIADVASPPSLAFSRLTGDASAFSPKAALSYFYDGGQVYLSYGRGFSSNFGTTFEWDAAQYARPENKPSTLTSYEIGWKTQGLADRLQFETAIFYSEQTNKRQVIPNPEAEVDFTAPANRIDFGSLYTSRGFEAALQWQPWEGGRITAQYSWLDPEWKDYIIQSAFAPPVDLSGKTPRGISKNIVYLAAEQRFTPWLLGRATVEYYDDYQVTQDNSIENGGYSLLSLGATISPQRWETVSVNVVLMNALDEDYNFYFGDISEARTVSPGVPRQLRATLRMDF
jgi:outer membrane receptor protein involved in Fe transport